MDFSDNFFIIITIGIISLLALNWYYGFYDFNLNLNFKFNGENEELPSYKISYIPNETEKEQISLRINQHLNNIQYYYSSENCSYCLEQEKYLNLTLLGNKKDTIIGQEEAISGLPTWLIYEKQIEGVLTFSELNEYLNKYNDRI